MRGASNLGPSPGPRSPLPAGPRDDKQIRVGALPWSIARDPGEVEGVRPTRSVRPSHVGVTVR